MKKTLLIISVLLFGGVSIFMGYVMQEKQSVTETQKYADARLSMTELQQGIEVKIVFLLDEVKASHVQPTEKGLIQLMQSITTVRAYGKDISEDAKENLRMMVKQLKNTGFKNEALLQKLDDLAKSSHMVLV